MAVLLSICGAGPAHADDYVLAWQARCDARAAELRAIEPKTTQVNAALADLNVSCLTTPLDICFFGDDPEDCLNTLAQAHRAELATIRGMLPDAVPKGGGLTGHSANRALARLPEDTDGQTCYPEVMDFAMTVHSVSADVLLEVCDATHDLLMIRQTARTVDRALQ